MTSSDSNADAIPSKYNIQIDKAQGPVIGDFTHVEQHFHGVPSEPQVDLVAAEAIYRQQVVKAYHRLSFGGLGYSDLFLEEVMLDDVFVRLTLTVEKVLRAHSSSQQEQSSTSSDLQRGIIDLVQALKKPCLLVGEPGAGKSTLLRWLAVTFAQGTQQWEDRLGPEAESGRLPILVELGRLPEHYLNPASGEILSWKTFLPTYVPTQEFFIGTPPELLSKALTNGRCLLLFDGLDEVPYPTVRARLARSLVDFSLDIVKIEALVDKLDELHQPTMRLYFKEALVDKLDELYRLAMRLHFVEGCTYQQIASKLHLPESTVKSPTEYSMFMLRELAPQNRVVVGTRPGGLAESESLLRPIFQCCQIERFSPEDVTRFFHFWYNLDYTLTAQQRLEKVTDLITHIQTVPGLFQIATTPLLSTILLLIWPNSGTLPERRVQLYEQCSRILLDQWEVHHAASSQDFLTTLPWELHLRLLMPIAYFIHSQVQRTNAHRQELIPVLAACFQQEEMSLSKEAAIRQAEQFLESLGRRSGLLQYLGADLYGFPHLTFQEYLTARYIAIQPDPEYIDLVMSHLHETWWREVHLLTIGCLGSTISSTKRASALLLTILHQSYPPGRLLHLSLSRLGRHISWFLGREVELAVRGYSECAPDLVELSNTSCPFGHHHP
jgi:predicted NACHT family NTPase